jgi:hypothetical protein
MAAKDILSFGFSLVSLLISLLTLYLTQFRPSNVTASTGPFIHIFYVLPNEPTIFLPVVFHNSSPTKAIVYKAFLEVEDTKGQHFAMKWTASVKIDLSNKYTDTEVSGPFKIDGYETISNALRFFWVNGEPQFDWLEGSYKTKLDIWTSDSVEPDYSTSDNFHINKEVAAIMAEKKLKSDNTSRFLPLEGKALISFSTGKDPIDFRKIPKL